MVNILIVFIFARPFIASTAFPYLNYAYSSLFLLFLGIAFFSKKAETLNQISSLRYPMLFFCLSLIASLIFSFDKLNSLEQSYKYLTAILLFLITASLSDEDKMSIIRAITFASFIISILAIYQYFFGFQHVLDYLAKERISEPFALDYIATKRVFYPFVTPNLLGGYLAMTMPLVLIHNERRWMILPLFFALTLTKSLGAFFSLFAGVCVYVYLRKGLSKNRLLALGTLILAAVFIFILRQTAAKTYTLPDFSLIKRLSYWQETIKIIRAHPLMGVGIGNYNLALTRYAHNSFLQFWAEAGIFALASFLWLIYKILKNGLKNIGTRDYKTRDIALITAAIIFLAHNLVDFSFFLPETALTWWVILGLIKRQ